MEKIKDKLSIIGAVILVAVMIAGLLFGPPEMRDKALAAGLLAAVTGIPAAIYSLFKGNDAKEQSKEQSREEGGSPPSDALANDIIVAEAADSVQEEFPITAIIASNDNVNKDEIPAEMLRKLKMLYDEGVFSEEEYTEKKKQILGI